MRLPSRANNKRETVDVPRKKKRLWCQIVEEFCSHTTIHGLNHVAEKLFTPFERTVWCWLFLLAVVGASFCGNQVWDYYKTGSTATFVESTRYQYSNVPFPAVILCDKSRVHWPKALALTKHDLPEPFNVTKQKALVLLKRLGYVTFGDFDFLNQIRFSNMTFEEIAELNITELMLKVMRPCNEMFSELCIWRSLEYNCCRLFELQKSELGFCYSFNSDTSEISKSLSYGWAADGKEYWVDAWGDKRPRRTAQLGSWGGLRFTVNVLPQSEMPPDGNNTTPGIALMVTDPKAFPMDSYVEIGSGQFGLVSVVGDALATEARVRSVLPQHRKCLFYQETDSTSPTGYYLEANCKTLCFQKYSIKYCNCSPEFMFFNNDDKGNKFPDCNVEGLLCLSRVNGKLDGCTHHTDAILKVEVN
ncbi:hypothetical protein AAG570_009628 [Ranatra chinensis]|uniref:Uncharacterized protein n=1 Tax=Ranatra chinensis TaxID=642074 RepID=A0ABD0ZAR6_9HEMI